MEEEAGEIIEGIVKKMCWEKQPYFITGTRMAVNNEWEIASENLNKKTPLIWLLEIIDETGYFETDSPIERDIRFKIFFLDQTNSQQYYTKDHRQKVVKPMQKLMFEFIKTAAESGDFDKIEKYKFKTFARFGEETKDGVLKLILDADLSGVGLEIELSRFKKINQCQIF